MLIGDDLRDLEAGQAAGVRAALVCTGKGRRVRGSLDEDALVFKDLTEAAMETVAPGRATRSDR